MRASRSAICRRQRARAHRESRIVQRLAAWSWPVGEPATGNIRARAADSHHVARWFVAISGAMLAISAAFVLVELRFMHPAVVVPVGVGPCLCGLALAML